MGERATLMDSFTEMTEILLPNDTNDLGRALGGVVLHWMDLCGAVAAMRFSTRHCVTAAMDNADFVGPTEPAEIAVIEWYVFDVGSSSMEVRAGDPRRKSVALPRRRFSPTSPWTRTAPRRRSRGWSVPPRAKRNSGTRRESNGWSSCGRSSKRSASDRSATVERQRPSTQRTT